MAGKDMAGNMKQRYAPLQLDLALEVTTDRFRYT
jgi:hypothetical protein